MAIYMYIYKLFFQTTTGLESLEISTRIHFRNQWSQNKQNQKRWPNNMINFLIATTKNGQSNQTTYMIKKPWIFKTLMSTQHNCQAFPTWIFNDNFPETAKAHSYLKGFLAERQIQEEPLARCNKHTYSGFRLFLDCSPAPAKKRQNDSQSVKSKISFLGLTGSWYPEIPSWILSFSQIFSRFRVSQAPYYLRQSHVKLLLAYMQCGDPIGTPTCHQLLQPNQFLEPHNLPFRAQNNRCRHSLNRPAKRVFNLVLTKIRQRKKTAANIKLLFFMGFDVFQKSVISIRYIIGIVFPTTALYLPGTLQRSGGPTAGFLFTINSSICSCYVTRCVSRILKSWNQRIRWEWNSATEFHGRLHVRTSPCLTACGGNWGKQISPGTHQPIVFRRNESRPIKNTWRSMMKYLSVWETTEPSISDQNITPTITALVFPCPQKV